MLAHQRKIAFCQNYSFEMLKIIPLIHRATEDDAALLAELGARTFHETFADSNKPEDMAAYLTEAFCIEKQAAELKDAKAVFFIAELQSKAVGYAKLQKGAPPSCIKGAQPVELARLYVLREWIGRGVGFRLMHACIDEAKSIGCETMWLGVWEHNRRARAFYAKWNFCEAGAHVFQLGSDAQTDLLLERIL
jgi:GNAT superfamily N-acetyltransferase